MAKSQVSMTVNGKTVTSREALSLSADGTELNVDTTLSLHHGYASIHPDAKASNQAGDVYLKTIE